MSGTEKGQNVLLFVGDGGAITFTGTVHSIVGATGGGTISRSGGSYVTDGYAAGMVLHVTGFTTNEEFHGIAATVGASDITLSNVVDYAGNPIDLVDEVAGDSVTIIGEAFNLVRGQDDTGGAIAAGAIDASTKDTGKWGASLSGTNKMTVTANGKVTWPDTNGVMRILEEMEDQGLVWLKLVLNIAGDYWYGQFANTSLNVSGAKDGATIYNLTFENKLRPKLVQVA